MEDNTLSKKMFLYVPAQDKVAAESVGVKWDSIHKSFFAPKGTEQNKINEWIPENQAFKINIPFSTAIDPYIAFQDELTKRGFEVLSSLDVSSKFNRVHIEGHKRGTRNGVYRIFNDNIPTIWLKDWSTGVEESIPHKDSDYNGHLTDKALKELKEINRIKNLQRDYDKSRMQYAITNRLEKEFKSYKDALSHPYCDAKKIIPKNAKLDEHKNLVIAFRNVNDTIKTAQRISPKKEHDRWSKYWEKNAEKNGNFAIIGARDFSEFKQQYKNKIILAEGYATAVSVHAALKHPVIMTGDSYNITPVVSKLISNLGKDVKIIIAADNDILVKSPIINPGLYHAKEAAKIAKELGVKTKIVSPYFSNSEIQKGLTDFNDLAASIGPIGVKKQIFNQLTFKPRSQHSPKHNISVKKKLANKGHDRCIEL